MLAVIGFFVCLIAGVASLGLAAMIVFGCSVLGSKMEWPPIILYGAIGSALLCYALVHSPFIITVAG